MHNKTTATISSNYLLYPVISLLLIFSLLMAGCSDDENEGEPPVPNYTIIVKDIQNMPDGFTFDRVEVKLTGADWQVIETLIFPNDNGQIIMDLPTVFSPEVLQKVDRRGGDMGGHWTGTSNDGDALVATLGDFFVFKGDKKVGRIALSNWAGKGSSAGKAMIGYQFADRPFSLTGSDKSYDYSDCSFVRGWNMFANINPASGNSTAKVLRTTIVPESTLFWRLAESYVYE